jgi:hypothetical protein
MARWRLLEAHYLNVPGTEWEYKESDRETGRQARRIFPVPLYLDPKDQADWNDRENQWIVVSHHFDKAHPRDYVFTGPPTPNMEPIDDEATAMSQSYIDKGLWKHPIDSMNMTYSQSVLSEFEAKLASMLAGRVDMTAPPPNVSTAGVSQKQFEELQATVKQLLEQNASLQNQILDQGKRSSGLVRRL